MKFISYVFLCLILLSACDPAESNEVTNTDSDFPVSQELVDYSCDVDTDCVVMDIGSCCGYNPACVNQKSNPDPIQVSKECAESGLTGVCGFSEIENCYCVESICSANKD